MLRNRLLASALGLLVWSSSGSFAEPLPLRAELRDAHRVELLFEGRNSGLEGLGADQCVLLDKDGNSLEVSRVLHPSAGRATLFSLRNLDLNQAYFVEIPAQNLRARCRFDGWFREVFSSKPLGANVSEDGKTTHFAIFAPRAERVTLYLYDQPDETTWRSQHQLKKDADGVWELSLSGDLHGTYYDFTVHGQPGPGNRFYGTHPVHVSDPYARVNVEAQGKSRVWHRTQPATPLKNGRPPMESLVAYEVHVQDFTDLLPIEASEKGTFVGMGRQGLTNSRGQPIGFDHLVELGINTVHLMPVQEFLHHPQERWQSEFSQDPTFQRLGIAQENYQWGYRTTHALAIENRFRTRGTEHGAQREQFRDLVQAFHDHDIAVVVDIVPNHTGENMDGLRELFNFGALDSLYYYRTDEEGELIGPYGNEVKTEDRPMVRRWLLDQCKSLIAEFGLDGFRIDLAGQIDEESLRVLRRELGADVILYGEPWIDVSDAFVKSNPDWDWYKEDAPISFFQDSARDAFIGSPFRLEEKKRDRGYAGGNGELRESAMRALSNDYFEEAESTGAGLNYLDIHDNWTLADRFAREDWNGLKGVEEDRYRIAIGLLLTSAGPVVLHGGSEIMRSKGAASEEGFERKFGSATLYFKGRHDTYNVRAPNRFLWDSLDQPETQAMRDFWRGLIEFRRSPQGEVFRQARIPADHYRWVLPGEPQLLGYVVGDQVFVMVNIGDQAASVPLPGLAEGSWMRVCDGERMDPAGLPSGHLGQGAPSVSVPARSFQMWVRR
jgi:pullulanase